MSACSGTVLISKSGFQGAFVSCTVEQRQNNVSSERTLISAGIELELDTACPWPSPSERIFSFFSSCANLSFQKEINSNLT